ncbi:MAG: protein kinase [Planctomycetes bacterium]|nr:protein kinase [Planctomycetota bacterium]
MNIMSEEEQVESSIEDELQAGGFKEALEQTMSSRDFTAAAVRSLAENLLHRDNSASMDMVKGLLNTLESKELENEVDFHIETSDVTLSDKGIDQPENGPGRYEVKGHLGTGAAGQVFSVMDHNFDREIAVKFLHQQASHDIDMMTEFVDEAKLSAGLEHPNILPIHDVNISDGGMLYFSMQKAKGMSLKQELDFCREQKDLPREVRDFGDRVEVLIKVCEAIAYAHSKDIIHQDIKPANIMIGKFGEVVVVDWGTAAKVSELGSGRGKLVGTPIYMAPEQARREQSTQKSDIYCLGACFFHMLTLHFPTWNDDIDTFWEMKQAGVINKITKKESRTIPRQLLSIAEKAMAVDPQDRYASVSDLIDDLKSYQEGRTIEAHKDGLSDVLSRVYRHNKRTVWIASLACVCALVVGYVLYVEMLKSQSQWQVYAQEDFSQSSLTELSKDWQAYNFFDFDFQSLHTVPLDEKTPWGIVDGKLFCNEGKKSIDGKSNLTFRSDVPGDIRIEFDYTPHSDNPLPLGVFIGGDNRFTGFHAHIDGKVQGGFATYLSDDGDGMNRGLSYVMEEAVVPIELRTGQTYHYIFERDGNWVRLFIEGKAVFDIYDIDMHRGPGHQQFGFEESGHYTLDNLVVYSRPLAQHVSPLSVADAYFRIGDYAKALAYYRSLVQAYPGGDIHAEALYRIGRCLSQQSQHDEAISSHQQFLAEFSDHWLVDYVYYEIASARLQQDDLHNAGQWYGKISKTAGKGLRRDALVNIIDYQLKDYKDLNRMNPTRMHQPQLLYEIDMAALLLRFESELDMWSEKLDTQLYSRHHFDFSIGYMWMRLGNFDHILDRYSTSAWRYPVGEALRALGRHEEIMQLFPYDEGAAIAVFEGNGDVATFEKRFGHQEEKRIRIMMMRQEYEEILQLDYSREFNRADALIQLGRYEEVVEKYPHLYTQNLIALLGLGRYADLLKNVDHRTDILGNDARYVGLAHVLLGNEEVVIEQLDQRSIMYTKALTSLAIKAWEKGDREKSLAYFDRIEGSFFDFWLPNQMWIGAEHFIIPPFMRFIDNGDREAFDQAMAKIKNQKPMSQIHLLQTMLDRMNGGTQKFKLTNRMYGQSEGLYDALGKELQGDKQGALQLYQLARDHYRPHQRDTLYMFIELRIKDLSQ